MRKINIERVLLLALLILTSINLVFTVINANNTEHTKPIEQRTGYWVEEAPDFQKLQLEIVKGD